MEKREKTIHQLKRDVLIAYLSKKTPGLSLDSKRHFDERYEKARKELEEAIQKHEDEKAG